MSSSGAKEEASFLLNLPHHNLRLGQLYIPIPWFTFEPFDDRLKLDQPSQH